jgi:stage IV sporulation protein FB
MRMVFNKIPLTVTPQFWVMCVILGLLSSSTFFGLLYWIPAVFISVLVHELGHAIFSIFWGQRVRIELGPFGGATILESKKELAPLKEFMVILMGPLFGFLLAGLSFIFVQISASASVAFLQNFFGLLTVINIFWSIVNLLPVYPLDGGKIMGVLFENIFGRAGLRASFFLSVVFGVLFAIFFMTYQALFLGVLLLLFSYDSFMTYRQLGKIAVPEKEKEVEQEIDLAVQSWLSSHPQEAIARLEKVCEHSQQASGYIDALERLCHYLIATKQYKKAYKYLEKERARLSFEGLSLLQIACFHTQNYRETLEVGEGMAREGMQISDSALLNAFAAGHLERVEVAINWLRALTRDPTINLEEVLKSEHFQAIAQTKGFTDFCASLG